VDDDKWGLFGRVDLFIYGVIHQCAEGRANRLPEGAVGCVRTKADERLIRHFFDRHRERQEGIRLYKNPLEEKKRLLISGDPISNPLKVAGEKHPYHHRVGGIEYLANLLQGHICQTQQVDTCCQSCLGQRVVTVSRLRVHVLGLQETLIGIDAQGFHAQMGDLGKRPMGMRLVMIPPRLPHYTFFPWGRVKRDERLALSQSLSLMLHRIAVPTTAFTLTPYRERPGLVPESKGLILCTRLFSSSMWTCFSFALPHVWYYADGLCSNDRRYDSIFDGALRVR